MQQQVNDDRLRARQLLYISQEIIKLKLRLDEELSQINSIDNQPHPWIDDSSITELMRRINYEIDSEKESRQKLSSYRSDILLAEEHLNEYRMSNPTGPSSSNIDEHLHSCRLALEQLTDQMDTYQTQLRTLSTMIDNLLPIETQIEQKLSAFEYHNNSQIELPEIQRLVDKYEQIMSSLNRSMNPPNSLHSRLKNHCETKLDLYKKMLNDFFRKSQSKHVSFDGSINLNNNNSSIYQQYLHDTNQSFRERKFRRTEAYSTSNDNDQDYQPSNKQSSTSSYISDDCKVLYIETVIEVDKPVIYERSSNQTTTTNTEYHHQVPQRSINTEYHYQVPQRSINTEYHYQVPQRSSTNTEYHHKISPPSSSNNSYVYRRQIHESSDDDSHKPVNRSTITTATSSSSKKSHIDSGIEYDQTSQPNSSSSSTICNQRTINNKFLIPPITSKPISQSKSVQRLHSNKSKSIVKTTIGSNSLTNNSYSERLRQTWLRSLLLGLLLLLLLFFVYFSRLDTCTRSTIIRTVFRKIICIENEGLPTF